MRSLRREGIQGETVQLSSSPPGVPASTSSEAAYLFIWSPRLCDAVVGAHLASSMLLFSAPLPPVSAGIPSTAVPAHGHGYCALPTEATFFFRQKIKVVKYLSVLEGTELLLPCWVLQREHSQSLFSSVWASSSSCCQGGFTNSQPQIRHN